MFGGFLECKQLLGYLLLKSVFLLHTVIWFELTNDYTQSQTIFDLRNKMGDYLRRNHKRTRLFQVTLLLGETYELHYPPSY